MGDIARQALCERYIKEFGDELLEECRVNIDGKQEIEVDQDCNVRLHVYLSDDDGNEILLLDPEVLFTGEMDRQSSQETLAWYLLDDEDDSEDDSDV